MIDQILIMTDSGLPLFDWTPNNDGADSNLVSGFLTALNLFAEGERGEQIRKITMDPTTFIFQREQNQIFVILTKDPEFEKIILLILTEIKERFLDAYSEAAQNFNGNVEQFTSFKDTVDQILHDYGYFDYLQAQDSFQADDSLRGVIFIDNTTGKPIYVKAKEYLDSEKLGFQSVILQKTFDRMVRGILHEEPVILNVISESMRAIIIKHTEKNSLVAEIQHENTAGFPHITISDKTLRAVLKKQPREIIAKIQNPFVIFDENGKVLWSSDEVNRVIIKQSIADCITIGKTSINIINQLFKEQLLVTILATEEKIYLITPLLRHFALISFTYPDMGSLRKMVAKLVEIKAFDTEDMNEFGKVLKAAFNLKKFFA
jgi:hypothetical protein